MAQEIGSSQAKEVGDVHERCTAGNPAAEGAMRKRISRREIAIVRKFLFLIGFSLVFAMVGCSSTDAPTRITDVQALLRNGTKAYNDYFVIGGRLVNQTKEPPFSVITYQATSASGAEQLKLKLMVYEKTLPAQGLPRHAWLLLTVTKDGQIELAGRHAQKSIFDADQLDEALIRQKVKGGSFLPPKGAWIAKNKAVSIARRMVGNGSPGLKVQARREVFGWRISLIHEDEIGGGAIPSG